MVRRAQPGRIGNVTGQNYTVSRRNYFGKVRGFVVWRYQSAFSGDWVSVLWGHADPLARPSHVYNIHNVAHYVREGV